MRKVALILLAGVAMAQSPEPAPAARPAYKRIGTMSQLMINMIYPTSDAVFYVERNEPKTDVDWNNLQNQALMLAEAGNLLLMPGRSREQENWAKFTGMMIEAGTAAFKAAQARDLDGVVAVNDLLYRSCVECHQEYRANYPKGRLPAPK